VSWVEAYIDALGWLFRWPYVFLIPGAAVGVLLVALITGGWRRYRRRS
jgi:hypothetical protein